MEEEITVAQFYIKITNWLLPNGYTETYSNHPLSKERRWDFIKDGIRVVCIFPTHSPKESYCYLHKDIIITPEPLSLVTGRFSIGNNYVIDYLHKYMITKSSLIE
jgi:hypothetical protein